MCIYIDLYERRRMYADLYGFMQVVLVFIWIYVDLHEGLRIYMDLYKGALDLCGFI